MNIVICDDNTLELDLVTKEVKSVLENISDKCDVYTVFTRVDFLNLIETIPIDILIIDVKLKTYNGLDMVNEFIDTKKTLVIYVTNHDNFIYTAIKYQPFGFVRKNHISDLKVFIEKAIEKKSNDDYYIQPSNQECIKITLKDIVYFDTFKNYVVIHTVDDLEYSMRKTLKTIETELENKNFKRIHSSYLVNMDYVYVVGKDYALMKYGDKEIKLPVSRKNKSEFLESFFSQGD